MFRSYWKRAIIPVVSRYTFEKRTIQEACVLGLFDKLGLFKKTLKRREVKKSRPRERNNSKRF